MVTAIEFNKTVDVSYEPSAKDKILRVLYRLEHGEQLCHGILYNGNNFCVLGLFADESGLGSWVHDDKGEFYEYTIGDNKVITSLAITELIEYYDFHQPLREKGTVSFVLNQVSNALANQIKCLYYDEFKFVVVEHELVDLYSVNDIGISTNYVGTNQLLADIIRSGVLFN